jgi:RHS repeat-associated protein
LKIFSQNRLISMTAPVWTQPAGGFLGGQTTLDAITLSFRYDGLSRRISKKVTTTKNGVVTSTMEGYLYEGWNPVMITKLDPAATSETVLTRKWSCLWRPDVGSSLYARSSWQKAGGVGGLAWLQTGAAQTLATDNLFSLQGAAEIHIPMADHMGNIRNYIHARATTVNDGSGSYAMVNYTPSANFEYDAFGREVRANGTTVAATNTPPGLTAGTAYADALPFHFSSKFTDPESGLNYYGYRYYDPKDGRWLGRDPIGENGGMNLFGMLLNDTNNFIDVLGLAPPVDTRNPANCPCKQADINRVGAEYSKKAADKTRDFKQPPDALDTKEFPAHAPEYGGRICCNTKTRVVSATGPIMGKFEKNPEPLDGGKHLYETGEVDPEKAPPCPADTIMVAAYHSHPDGSGFSKMGPDGIQEEKASDEKWVVRKNMPLFMGNQKGELMRLDHVKPTLPSGSLGKSSFPVTPLSPLK